MKNRRKSTWDRLGSYLTAAIGVGTLAGTADAAIVQFFDSGSFIEGTVDNGDQTTIPVPLGDGSTLEIDSDGYGLNLELTFSGPSTGRFTGTGTFLIGLYPGVSLLHHGDPIYANNSGSSPSIGSLVVASIPQYDFELADAGFVGFVTPNGNKGWLAVGFYPSTGQFGFYGGAVATAGEELTAGSLGGSPIPEPASALSTMGLLASGLLIRRRKQVP
jgi:hypothetical protein